jgi:hypothetical protein
MNVRLNILTAAKSKYRRGRRLRRLPLLYPLIIIDLVIASFHPNKMGHNEDMTGIEVYTISFSSL